MISKGRWERIHNLLSASSEPLSDRLKIITFTLDELELCTAQDFVSVSGYPHNRTNWPTDDGSATRNSRDIAMERYCYANDNVIMETTAVEVRGVADLSLMARVLQQAKLRGCSIRLDLSPLNPMAAKHPFLNPRAADVQCDLQYAIAQVMPQIESISLDRGRHRCLEYGLLGHEHRFLESFTSLRELTLTPIQGDYRIKYREKNHDMAKAMVASAQHLRKLYLHIPSRRLGRIKIHKRVLGWSRSLLLADRLGELESLTLMWVPLSIEDLSEILRRCSRTLTYLYLNLDSRAEPGEAWLDVWEQLASMEELRYLKFERPETWCQDVAWGHERSTPGCYHWLDREREFVNRGEVKNGLAFIIKAERSRGK